MGAGLLKVGRRVEFAHPLVRSAAYGSATAENRRRVHHALVDATDAGVDTDRHPWQRARLLLGLMRMSPRNLSAPPVAHRIAAGRGGGCNPNQGHNSFMTHALNRSECHETVARTVLSRSGICRFPDFTASWQGSGREADDG
jgi:hypothetical protein